MSSVINDKINHQVFFKTVFDRRSGFVKNILRILLPGLMLGCAMGLHQQSPNRNSVFFNSFETPDDTLSWYWAGGHRLSEDTPPGGGRQALEISGSTPLPVASFISQPLQTGGYFVVECWGKTLNVGGYVELATVSEHEVSEAIQVHIIEPQWHHVQSSDTLYCPPHHSLMLSMQAGLVTEGSILVDLLQVKKISSSAHEKPLARKEYLRD